MATRAAVVMLAFLVLVLSPGASPSGATSGEPAEQIQLRARRFVPDPSRSLHLRSFRRSLHVLVQARPGALDALVDSLGKRGIRPLLFVPPNTIAAFIRRGTDLSANPHIRWVGQLDPLDKVSVHLELQEEEITLIVEFFPDVGESMISRLVRSVETETGARAGGATTAQRARRVGENTYLVRTDVRGLSVLASHHGVAFLFPASQVILDGHSTGHCGGALTPYGPVALFSEGGPGWEGPGCCPGALGYHFVNGTPDVPATQEHVEFRRALTEWSRVAALAWSERLLPAGKQTLDVRWVAGAHGDAKPFDGTGNVLAHAFYPHPPNPEVVAGDVHFDEDEGWKTGQIQDVFSVALHEVGHSLGLPHSDDPSAVMYEVSHGVVPGLSCDDVDRIRGLYMPAGAGADLHVQQTTLTGPKSFQARNLITAGPALQIGPPQTVEMRAGREIVLRPGFSTLSGASFHAWIDPAFGCDCSQPICPCEYAFLAPPFFTNQLNILYEIAEPGNVSITMTTVSGQIQQLVAGHRACGSYQTTVNGTSLAAGTYFFQIKAGSFQKTLTVVKL